MPPNPTLRHSSLGNPYASAVSLLATILAAGNIALGLVLLAAPHRVYGGSFIYVTGGEHRAAQIWGVGFLTSGSVALFAQWTHQKWPARISHAASAFGCIWWVLAFSVAVHDNTNCAPATGEGCISLTGCVAYAIIGACHCSIAITTPHQPRQPRR